MSDHPVDPQTRLREFCGWLSADIPELHHVEVPRLAESLNRFLAAAPLPHEEPPPEHSELIEDLREIERIYNRDRIAQPLANRIEAIFDKWLYEGSAAAASREERYNGQK